MTTTRHTRWLVLTLLLIGGCLPFLLFYPTILSLAPETPLPFRPSTPIEQFAAVATFFGVKLLYSAISAAAAILLFRRPDPDLRAIAWSMLFFFLGEACCFISVMVFHEKLLPLEHLHSLGMVLSLAFAAYATFELLDLRVLHYSDTRHCAAIALCRGCIKRGDPSCGLRQLFLFLIPATAAAATIPLFSNFRDTAYLTQIFRQPHIYSHPRIHQLYELRYLPLAAITLLAIAFFVLLFLERHPVPLTKILFSAALGAMGFSFLRLLLVATFIDNQVWFGAWEELTELLYVLLLTVPLLIFHRAIFPAPAAPVLPDLAPTKDPV